MDSIQRQFSRLENDLDDCMTRLAEIEAAYAEHKKELESKLERVRELCGTRLAGSAAELVLEALDG